MSLSYSCRLMDQAKVNRDIDEAADVPPVGDITERQARRLKP